MPTPLLLLLAACFGPTPEVTAVVPAVAMPGDTLRLDGTGFSEDDEALLTSGSTSIPLPIDVTSDVAATSVVPDDLPPGDYTLWVETEGGKHGAAVPFVVWRVDTEPPCDKRFALKVETSRTRRQVALERVYLDRPGTHDLYEGDTMAGLETTATTTRSGRACSGVWLRLTDGSRVLLADAVDQDLAPVARELAATLKVPLTSGATPPAP